MKNWKYLLVSLVAVLVLMMMGGMALADELDVEEVNIIEIERTEIVPIYKSGTASVYVSNNYVKGTFYANYDVSYSVQNGVYTANHTSATYDHFTGVVNKGDFVSINVSSWITSSGTLKISFKYQVKAMDWDGSTHYSDIITNIASVQLPAK